MAEGGCHCGAVRYEVSGEAQHTALCHCSDCRHNAGAPMVGWSAFDDSALTIKKGEPQIYKSSEHGRRHFCADCGTGLFYYNAENLPGIVDVQATTFDEPEEFAPSAHIQTAEKLKWMNDVHTLPGFERYPGM